MHIELSRWQRMLCKRKNHKTYVYELLFLALVFCATCLVLEYHVIVPAALHIEILLVEKRIS